MTPLPPSAVLSALRVNIFTRSGTRYHFDLYRVPFVDGLISPCKRVRVFVHTTEIDGEKIRLADQFSVYVNEKRVPDHQFSILRSRKPAQYRGRGVAKQTNGRATDEIFSHPVTL